MNKLLTTSTLQEDPFYSSSRMLATPSVATSTPSTTETVTTASTSSILSTIPIYSFIPGIILISLWSIYLLTLTIHKLCPIKRIKNKFCHLKLGGNLSPQAFQLNIANIDEEAITIVEDEEVYMNGFSYEKYRYTTLVSQMKNIRKKFLWLGIGFIIVSIPYTICILYYTYVLKDVLMARTQRMGYRMDFVKDTIEVLMDKELDLIYLSQNVVNSLASNAVQSCFQNDSSNNDLMGISNNASEAMSRIEFVERDLNEVIESVTGASELSNEISGGFNAFFTFIWISISVVTLLNFIILILMYGAKQAQNHRCSSRHNLIHNLIAYPCFVFFTTLLWIVAAVFSFTTFMNVDFCGVSESESALDLLSALGYEYSVLDYFAKNYMQGCPNGEELGVSIVSLSQNLQDSLSNATMLQDLMSSGNSCDAFSSTSNDIDLLNVNFAEITSNLNATSYVIKCDSVQQWYSDLSLRASCSDLPNFGAAVLALLLTLALIASIMSAFTVVLKTDIELFLDLSSEELIIDGVRTSSKSRLSISSRRINNTSNDENGMVQKAGVNYVESEKKLKKQAFDLRRGKRIQHKKQQDKIEQLKKDINMIMQATEYQHQPLPAQIRVTEDVQQQHHPQYVNKTASNFSPQKLKQVLNENKVIKSAPPKVTSAQISLQQSNDIGPKNHITSKLKHSQVPQEKSNVTVNLRHTASKPPNLPTAVPQFPTYMKDTREKVKDEVNRVFSNEKSSPISDIIKDEIVSQLYVNNYYQLEQVRSVKKNMKDKKKKQHKKGTRVSSKIRKTTETVVKDQKNQPHEKCVANSSKITKTTVGLKRRSKPKEGKPSSSGFSGKSNSNNNKRNPPPQKLDEDAYSELKQRMTTEVNKGEKEVHSKKKDYVTLIEPKQSRNFKSSKSKGSNDNIMKQNNDDFDRAGLQNHHDKFNKRQPILLKIENGENVQGKYTSSASHQRDSSDKNAFDITQPEKGHGRKSQFPPQPEKGYGKKSKFPSEDGSGSIEKKSTFPAKYYIDLQDKKPMSPSKNGRGEFPSEDRGDTGKKRTIFPSENDGGSDDENHMFPTKDGRGTGDKVYKFPSINGRGTLTKPKKVTKQVSWSDTNLLHSSEHNMKDHQDSVFRENSEAQYQDMGPLMFMKSDDQTNDGSSCQHQGVYPGQLGTDHYHDHTTTAQTISLPEFANYLYTNPRLHESPQSNTMFNHYGYYQSPDFNAQAVSDILSYTHFMGGEQLPHDNYDSDTFASGILSQAHSGKYESGSSFKGWTDDSTARSRATGILSQAHAGKYESGSSFKGWTDDSPRRSKGSKSYKVKLPLSYSSETTSYGETTRGNQSSSYSNSTRSFSTQSTSDEGSDDYDSRYESYSGSDYLHSDESSDDSRRPTRRRSRGPRSRSHDSYYDSRDRVSWRSREIKYSR